MAKGSGLFIEQFSDQIPLFLHHHHRPNLKTEPQQQQLHNMENESNGLELSIIQFPVNLSCGNDHDDDRDAGSSPSDHNCERKVIDEMDFFARNESNKEEYHHEQTLAAATSADDKDDVMNVNTGLHLLTANTGSDQSTIDDGISPISEDKRSEGTTDKLVALQVEIARINRENQQLKDTLNQVNHNYNALQMHLVTLMQQQKHHLDSKSERENQEQKSNEDDNNDCKSKHSIVQKGEGWVPNKAPRFIESSSKTNGNSNVDQATEATMRKARVSVRARSEAPMISDGCQWRKYGQKMAKGNPCPRAYYRCTMAGGCPVRKQVQRCAEERTILITTYEGTHSHPLPPAAMMMASATSSAARMLLSGSMPSPDGTGFINNAPNFVTYNRSLFPGSPSSVATISASAPFPTVTLDLTQSPNATNNTNPLHHLFQRPTQTLMPAQLFGQPLYNQSRFSGLQVSGQENGNHNNENNPLADTVTALTTDPNFTAALAAAITSLIGNGGGNNSDSNGNIASSNGNNSNGN